MSHAQWMNEALRLARKAGSIGEVPVGAVVVRDGKIISEGYNLREKNHSPLAHAEMEAIAGAARALRSWRLENCELYVTLEPCAMCLGAIQQARITRVYYGAHDQKMGALSLGYKFNEDLRTNHRFAAQFIETPEAGQVLSDFFRQLRKSDQPG